MLFSPFRSTLRRLAVEAVKPARRAMNDSEAQSLLAIRGQLNDAKTLFCCGGRVPEEMASKRLFFNSSTEEALFIDLPATTSDALKLHHAASPSPFGKDEKLVLDPEYRDAREILADRFALNFDPSVTSEILKTVASRGGQSNSLHATLDKLNSYSQGGFFKAHQDTPKSEEHLGTLVICLPSEHEGGELVVRHGEEEVIFSWTEACAKGQTSWAFLFADCQHEVLPVTSGTRLTLSYDVFSRPTTSSPALVDYAAHPLYRSLKSLVASPSFLPEGGLLAVGLEHKYPLAKAPDYVDFGDIKQPDLAKTLERNNASFVESLAGRLKGSDAVLLGIVQALNLPAYSFKAVYTLDPFEDDVPEEEIDDTEEGWEQVSEEHLAGLPADAFTARQPGTVLSLRTSVVKDVCLFTSDSFAGPGIDEVEWQSDLQKMTEMGGATVASEAIWLRPPQGFTQAMAHSVFGNTPCIDYTYVAVALFVTLPPTPKVEQ